MFSNAPTPNRRNEGPLERAIRMSSYGVSFVVHPRFGTQEPTDITGGGYLMVGWLKVVEENYA
jgi:hypothetical protein